MTGINSAQPVVKGQDKVGEERPHKGKNQRLEWNCCKRDLNVLNLEVPELALHHPYSTEQQSQPQHGWQMPRRALQLNCAEFRHGSVGIRLAGESGTDQSNRLRNTVKCNKPAKARALLLAEQDLIQAAKPNAEFREGVPLANLIHRILDDLRIALRRQCTKRNGKILQGLAFHGVRMAVLLGRTDKVAIIGNCVFDKAGEQRLGFGAGAGNVTLNETPQDIRSLSIHDAG